MKKKTYGVYGLMELNIIVTAGKRQFRIPFADGITNAYGVTPATYTTGNPIIQYAIETNPSFLNGKIKLLKTLEVEDVKNIDKSTVEDTVASTDTEPKKAIVFSSADDAKTYLNETFNIPLSQMRSLVSIKELAKERGIEIRLKN